MVKLTRVTDPLPVVVLAGVAAYGSFSRISALARRSGQEGPMAWATAVAIDLACLVATREIRRDRKAGKKPTLPLLILVCGIVLSLLANVAEAPPTAWGKVMAATPALALLAAVSLLERRGSSRPAERPQEPSVAKETREVPGAPEQHQVSVRRAR